MTGMGASKLVDELSDSDAARTITLSASPVPVIVLSLYSHYGSFFSSTSIWRKMIFSRAVNNDERVVSYNLEKSHDTASNE